MKEYTLLALLAAVVAVILDMVILRTRILRQPTFWIYLMVMYAFKTIVNGYLTWRPIVTYGEKYYLGARIFTIPVEDYVYGFALIALTVVLWEYLKRKDESSKRGSR